VRDLLTGQTQRASVGSNGQEGDQGTLYHGLLSDDGRYVAFFSLPTNLVPNDTNNHMDVFVRDMKTKTTELASFGIDGQQANGDSYFPSFSSDGRYLAFTSEASNLVPGDNNLQVDVFLLDRKTRQMQLVSVGPKGTQGDAASSYPHVSANGRYISFQSNAANLVPGDTNGKQDVFVRDMKAGKTTRVSLGARKTQGNGDSFLSAMSADARHLGFSSDASKQVADDSNGVFDVFIRDRLLDSSLSADLSLSQTDAPDPVASRGKAVYVLKVVNHGPDMARNVTLSDILPVQGVLVQKKASQGSCSMERLLVCTLGSLAKGQEASVTLTVRAEKGAASLANQAQVSSPPIDFM
jgi:uncharacterized repeat protein (TIGR01451 family)